LQKDFLKFVLNFLKQSSGRTSFVRTKILKLLLYCQGGHSDRVLQDWILEDNVTKTEVSFDKFLYQGLRFNRTKVSYEKMTLEVELEPCLLCEIG
jgi:hypothetical protein